MADREMSYLFPAYEVVLRKRGRKTWRWCVCTEERVVMQGSESNRPAATYHARRALFLLLMSARCDAPSSFCLNNPKQSVFK
jgi:hypothetical protein